MPGVGVRVGGNMTYDQPETAMTLESKLNRKLSFCESHPRNGCEILYIIEFLVKQHTRTHTHSLAQTENLCIQLPKT